MELYGEGVCICGKEFCSVDSMDGHFCSLHVRHDGVHKCAHGMLDGLGGRV